MQTVVLGEWAESLYKVKGAPSSGQVFGERSRDGVSSIHHLCGALLGHVQTSPGTALMLYLYFPMVR